MKLLAWQEYIKGNYRFMTDEERAETIARLERLAKLQAQRRRHASSRPARSPA